MLMQLHTSELPTVRTALLALHRQLLEAQRVEVERIGGRMSAGELLQAATDDLRFSWLKELSELIAALDHASAIGELDVVEAQLAQARALLAPPDPATPFGARYLRALQDHPTVVLAHRDAVVRLLPERSP